MDANKPFIVSGLQNGDESKGKWTAFLSRKLNKTLNVRYNSGPNAMHNVVSKGIHHCFSQFGSTLFEGTPTLFSRYTLIEPLALANEAQILKSKVDFTPYDKLFIDARAKLITPFHVITNRLHSEKGSTTGMGIGVTVQDSIDRPINHMTVLDLLQPDLVYKLESAKAYIINRYGYNEAYNIDLTDLVERYDRITENLNILFAVDVNSLMRTNNLIFEGAQGILLDEDFGFAPYNSWSKTTKHNALKLLADAGITEKPINVGLTRIYSHKHGIGQLPSYDAELTEMLPEPHNGFNEYQGHFRAGWLDLNLLRYAIDVNDGIDYIAFSHTDYRDRVRDWKICTAYESTDKLTTETLSKAKPIYEHLLDIDIPEYIAELLKVKMLGFSYGAETSQTLLTQGLIYED